MEILTRSNQIGTRDYPLFSSCQNSPIITETLQLALLGKVEVNLHRRLGALDCTFSRRTGPVGLQQRKDSIGDFLCQQRRHRITNLVKLLGSIPLKKIVVREGL